MERFFPYLGVVAALLLGAFIAVFSSGTTIVRHPAPVASSTLAVLPGVTSPAISLENLLPGLTTSTSAPTKAAPSAPVATTTGTTIPAPAKPAPKPAVVAKPKPVVVTAPAAPVVQTPLPSFASGNGSLDIAATGLRSALVNIICWSPPGSTIHSISGTGVIVDPRGIILTNAHVAQMFLLADKGVSCTVRAGSPATDAYQASLMFISPAWIHDNAAVLSETAPEGDGQHDYAFLAVTGPAPGVVLSASLPAITLSQGAAVPQESVVIGSYGAQFLETSEIQSSLFPTIVFGMVKDVYTFATNSLDILALGGSAAAQEGSSGGGVVDASGQLVGTIAISTVDGDTSTRSLYAITASYIRRTYIDETGMSLETLFASSPATAVANFAPKIPALEALITAHLQ